MSSSSDIVHVLEQLRSRDPKGFGDLFKQRDRWIANATLDPADIRSMQPTFQGEPLLREASRFAVISKIETNPLTCIHPNAGSRMQTFDLQTMCFISLDCSHTASIAVHMRDLIHSHASSLRKQCVEYGFLDGLCKVMWKRGALLDVLRSHTDQSGYDLLLEAGGIQRHVQLKSSFNGAKTARQSINFRLAEKPSGCVVWIWFDPVTLEQTSFLWLGAAPGEPLPALPDRTGKHTKGNSIGVKAARPSIRVVNKGAFEAVVGFGTMAARLFG